MSVQGALLSKRKRTLVTSVRLFAAMHARVVLEIARECEKLFANVAFVGFLACVDASVSGERASLRKLSATVVAFVGFFATVNAGVSCQLARRRELLPANVALVRAFAAVHASVFRQLARRGELLRANVARVLSVTSGSRRLRRGIHENRKSVSATMRRFKVSIQIEIGHVGGVRPFVGL